MVFIPVSRPRHSITLLKVFDDGRVVRRTDMLVIERNLDAEFFLDPTLDALRVFSVGSLLRGHCRCF